MKTKTRKEEQNKAIEELLERGAENVCKEDRFGDTRSGWWIDDVYLGKDPIAALRDAKG